MNSSLMSRCWDTDSAHMPDDTVDNVEIIQFQI
jgi:hypothetical protein